MKFKPSFSIYLILVFLFTINATNAALSKLNANLTTTEIDVSIQTATAQGRVIEISSGGYSLSEAISSVAILPVVFRSKIDGWNYDIVVLEMNFEQGQAFLKMASKFSIPESPNSESIYFASDKIAFSSKNGFKGDMKILPATLSSNHNDEISPEAIELLNGKSEFLEIAIPGFGNRLKMGLNDDSKMTFSCGAFEKFVFSGYLKSYNTVIQENNQGQTINEGKPYTLAFAEVGVTDWQDMYFNATVANAFHAQAYSDLGFSFESSNTVTVDLSKRQNPNNLPKCANLSGDNWKGIYIESFDIRLPKFFKLKSGASLPTYKGKNLFIDPTGLVGNMVADKVFSLAEGTTNGQNPMDMSLDKITIDYSCNGNINGLFIGQIGFDLCDNSGEKFKNDYVFSYTNKAGYLYSLKETNSNRIKATNTISFPNGSSLSLNINDGHLDIQEKYNSSPVITSDLYNNSICKNYSGKLSVSNCNDFIEWSTGGSTSTIEITPSASQPYTVKCFDKYCINATVEPIEIVVYDKLDAPKLESSKDEEPYCATNEAILTNIESCPGIIEWHIDNDTWKALDGNPKTYRIYEPDINQNTTHTYATRCKLNTCYSEASNLVTLNLLKSPKKPSVESTPGDYTVCQTKWLNGSNCTNGNYRWYKNDNLIANTNSQVVVNQEGTYKYNVKCIDAITGCESEFYGDIYFKIERCHCAPNPTLIDDFSHKDKVLKEDENFTFVARACSSGQVHWYNGNAEIAVGNQLTRSEKAGTYTYEMKCINSDGCESSSTYTQSITVLDRCANEFRPLIPVYENAIPAAETTEQDIQIIMSCESGSTIYWYDSEKEEVQNGGFFIINSIPANWDRNIYIYTRCKNAAGCFSDFKIDGFKINSSKGGTNPCENINAPTINRNKTEIGADEKATLTASGCTGSVVWSNGLTGTKIEVGSGTYTAKCIIGVCESGNSNSINISNVGDSDPCANINTPTITSNKSEIGANEVATLTASGCTGSVNWSNGAKGTSIEVGIGTYTAKCFIGNCKSENSNSINIRTVGDPDPCANINAPTITSNKSEIGANEVATLTATGCGGVISWSNGATSTTISVTPSITTTYTVTCTTGSCEKSGSQQITVKGPCNPLTPIISCANNYICIGESVSISGISCNGKIVWSNGISGNTITVSPKTSTVYSARCQVGECFSQYSNNVQILVNTISTPLITASTKTVCSGDSVKLTASNCNGTVRWSNGASGASIGVVPLLPTTSFTATCSVLTCVSYSSNPVVITLRSIPTSPGVSTTNGNICSGQSTSLSATGCAGTVNWSNGQTGNTITVNPLVATSYSATCAIGSCVSIASKAISINVRSSGQTPTLTISKSTISVGENATIIASNCASSILWNTGAKTNSITVSPSSTTSYTAKCGKESCAGYSTITLNVSP